MKKGWKIFWLICGICIVVGIIFVGAAFTMGIAWDDLATAYPNGIGIVEKSELKYRNQTNGFHYTEDTEITKYKDVKKLSVDVSAGSLNFISTTDDQLSIEETAAAYKVEYNQDRGKLSIKTKSSVFGAGDAKLTIYVPENYEFDSVDLEVGAGEVIVNNLKAERFDAECGAGSMTINDSSFRNIDMECGAGEIDLTMQGTSKDYDYDLECGTGEIQIGDEQYSGFAREQHIDNQAEQKIDIECGIGKVTVNFENGKS